MSTSAAVNQLMNLIAPFVVLGITVFLLLRVLYSLRRHLFGIGYVATKRKGAAAILYIAALFPGILLREVSRWFVAGLVRVPPAFITPTPRVDNDGMIDARIFHFATFNPVYAAMIAAAPFLSGLAVVWLIAYPILNLPGLLALITTQQPEAFQTAVGLLFSRADLLIWLYILFGVANNMLPTTAELRATWFVWALAAIFFGLLAVIGLWGAIIQLLQGPVAGLAYILAAIFGLALGIDVIALVGILMIEAALSRVTRRQVQYTPPKPKSAKQTAPALASGGPRTVYEIRFPVPPAPNLLGAPSALPKMNAVAPPPAVPPRATGTDLPAIPKKAEPPAPEPAKMPPPRIERPEPAPLNPPKPAAGAIPPPKQTGTTLPPPKPAAEAPKSGGVATPRPSPAPLTPPKPSAAPAQPAASITGSGPKTETAKPLTGTFPTAKPNEPPKTGAFPAVVRPPQPDRPFKPAPKPASASSGKDEDIIEGEVIYEDDGDAAKDAAE